MVTGCRLSFGEVNAEEVFRLGDRALLSWVVQNFCGDLRTSLGRVGHRLAFLGVLLLLFDARRVPFWVVPVVLAVNVRLVPTIARWRIN